MDRSSWLCTGDSDQERPQEKGMQKGQILPEEALQRAEETLKAKEERKDILIWMQSSKE